MIEEWKCFITSVYEESYRSSGRTVEERTLLDHVSTEELLERADVKPMSKEVKKRKPGGT